jgi:hypothetical protein
MKQPPKTKLDSLISKRDSLAAQPRSVRFIQNLGKFVGAPDAPNLNEYLTNRAKQDSIKAVGMLPSIKKELVNIKPSKSVTAKLKTDNTRVAKTIVKKIVKSKTLVKNKK